MSRKIQVPCQHTNDTHLVEYTATGDYRPPSRHSPAEAPAIDLEDVPECYEGEEYKIDESIHEELQNER